METKCCSKCDTSIELKYRYEEGEKVRVGFKYPCNTCEHNETDEDRFPCAFCTREVF